MPAAIAGAIGLALFSIGAPLELATAAIVALSSATGAFLINTAIGVGLSLAAGALLKPAGAAAAPAVKPSDGQQAIRQAVPARMKSFGTVRLAGPVFWFDAEVNAAATTSSLWLGFAVNEGRIGGFLTFHIDENEVTLDGSGNVTTSPYASVTTKITYRLGLPTETTYSELAAAATFGVDNVRGDGVASMLGQFSNFATPQGQAQNYPGSFPRLRATINASVVWDPRVSAQSRLDNSTWQFSENPVLCLLTYLLDADGYAIDYARRIAGNLAQWKAAADICDEKVLSISAGGTENRYRLAMSYLLTDRPADVVARILTACDGRCWQKRDGTIGITVGRFVRPAVTLGGDDIVEWEMSRGQDPLSAVYGVRAQYVSPPHDYREQDADPWPDGQTVMELGEERVAALDLTTVPSHSQARRLMKREAIRQAAPWRGSVRTTLAGIRAIDERFVRVVIPALDLDEFFEVSRFSMDLAPPYLCSLAVLAVDVAIDAWNPTTEEGTPASQPVLIAWGLPMTQDVGFSGSSLSIRHIIKATSILAHGLQMRVTFEAGTDGPLDVSHASVGVRSGATADTLATPVEITFSGASGFSLLAGEVITSDWISVPIIAATDYLVIWDIPIGGRRMRISNLDTSDAGPGDDSYQRTLVTSWNQTSGAGFTLTSSISIDPLANVCISRIEVRDGP